MDLTEKIRDLALANLSPDKFLVDVTVSAKKGPVKILILLDGDQGVTIDDCAEVSRALSKGLEEQNLIPDNYTLEVSTPGVDHPLKLRRQYLKNIGRTVKLTLSENKVVEGKLTEVSGQHVVLNREEGGGKKKEIKTLEIPFSEIEKAVVLVSFK